MNNLSFDDLASAIVANIKKAEREGDSRALSVANAQLVELMSLQLAEARANIRDTLLRGDYDAAEAAIERMRELNPNSPHISSGTALVLIGRGRPADALRSLNEAEDEHPHVRALCLYLLDDPTWKGLALAYENDSQPYIRGAMRSLLGRPDAEPFEEPSAGGSTGENVPLPPTFLRG